MGNKLKNILTNKDLVAYFLKNFSGKTRRMFLLLVLFSIIVSIIEVVGLASLFPFLILILDPASFSESPYAIYFLNTVVDLGIVSQDNVYVFFGVLSALIFLISIGFRVLQNMLNARFVAICEYEAGLQFFSKFLSLSYIRQLSMDSRNVEKNILSETFMLSEHFISPLVNFIANFTTFVLLIGFLTLLNFKISIVIFSVIVLVGIVFIAPFSRIVASFGERRMIFNGERFQFVQTAFILLREIKVRGSEDYAISRFKGIAKKYQKSVYLMRALAVMPRYILEAFAFCSLLLVLTYIKLSGQSVATTLPLIAVYVASGYRAMPAVQNIYTASTQIRAMFSTLLAVSANLREMSDNTEDGKPNSPTPHYNRWHEIILKRVSFSYENNSTPILCNLNLKIKPGVVIGIVGKSGSGKTTLLNLLLGLLEPTDGCITAKIVDDQNQEVFVPHGYKSISVGYVPHDACLFNSSLKENVTLTLDDTEIDFLEKILDVTVLSDVVTSLEDGVDNDVGEKGSRLSGGQRQRVGIARALYNSPSLLILDEATAALDGQTEITLLGQIREMFPELAVVLVTHREATTALCDEVYWLDNGRLIVRDK